MPLYPQRGKGSAAGVKVNKGYTLQAAAMDGIVGLTRMVDLMRRLLHASIMFSWIAFMASVTVGGIGLAPVGLLQEMQAALMALPFLSPGFEAARAILTGVVVATLAAALWTAMVVTTTDREEHGDRVLAIAGGFSFVLIVCALSMLVAALAGAGSASAMLLGIQLATLLSMLASGGVEYAWEARPLASASSLEADGLAERVTRHMAASRARLAAASTTHRETEPV